MLRRSRASAIALFALLGMTSSSMAAGSNSPARAATPEMGPQKTPQDILRCDRNYLYRHKTLPCDSPTAADGEGLRSLLQSVPQARQELDLYQANRRGLSLTAYTGMAGLLIAAIGPSFSQNRGTKNFTMGLGISFTLASLAWGRYRLMTNEAHLDRAVRHFNDANPGDPITLLQPTATPPPPPSR